MSHLPKPAGAVPIPGDTQDGIGGSTLMNLVSLRRSRTRFLARDNKGYPPLATNLASGSSGVALVRNTLVSPATIN